MQPRCVGFSGSKFDNKMEFEKETKVTGEVALFYFFTCNFAHSLPTFEDCTIIVVRLVVLSDMISS